jgi:predicted dehydrogenase
VERELPIRVGVIGCGIGSFHLEGFAEEPRTKVVAIAGLEDRCQTLANKFGVPRVYGDYRELLADPEVQAVSIAVPNYMHREVTMAALRSGKDVLVEKPLAPTAEEGEEMIAASEETGRILMIAFNRRGRHDVELIKKEVEAGHLGRIYHARAFWMRRSGIPGLGSWFTTKALAGGGPLIDLGVHVLDLALWIMGNPRPVAVSAAAYAELGPRGKGQYLGSRFTVIEGAPYEVEDFATAMIRLDGGATLQLDASWAGFTGHTDEFGVSFMGDSGGAEIHVKDYAQTGTLKFYGEVGGMPAVTEPRLLPRHGHGWVIHRFVDAILSGKTGSPSAAEGLDRVRLIEAIYRSAELGREIEI